MHTSPDHAVYRLRRFYRKDDRPKKYRASFEVTDEQSGQPMAACDLIGQAVFATHRILDHQQQVWEMTPNRRFMPSRWTVSDSQGQVTLQFDQKILGKLTNPIYKVVLSIIDADGKERYRLVDPRTNIPDRIMGVHTGEWAIVAGDKPVAKLGWLPKEKAPPKGLFKFLKKFLIASDRALISAGPRHLLPAPAALGMLLLFNELTDTSGG
jgi:hypothetical protein